MPRLPDRGGDPWIEPARPACGIAESRELTAMAVASVFAAMYTTATGGLRRTRRARSIALDDTRGKTRAAIAFSVLARWTNPTDIADIAALSLRGGNDE